MCVLTHNRRRSLRPIRAIAAALSALLCGGLIGAAPLAFAAPITFNTALPISEDEVILREQLIFAQSSGRAGGRDVRVNSLTALTVGGYGISPKWSVFGVLPLTHIDREFGPSASSQFGPNGSSQFGLGDAVLFSRYEIFRRDSKGGTTRLAPLLGVRVPTGETGVTSDGSVDVFGGLVATLASTKFNFGGQILYTVNGEANDFQAGDSLAFDSSLQYRLWPQNLSAATRGFLFGVIEGNVTWQDEARAFGAALPQSGGTSLSISPGLQYAAQRWILETAVTLPIADNFSNDSIRPDYSVRASLRLNF